MNKFAEPTAAQVVFFVMLCGLTVGVFCWVAIPWVICGVTGKVYDFVYEWTKKEADIDKLN